MNRAAWLRILFVVAVSVALAGTPKSSFAQRGGGGFHGGGGGFHGGGFGGGGFHGAGGGFRGGNFGGFRGNGFGGFHNGYGGFHNGWGRGGWGRAWDWDDRWGWGGWGWGLNISFGWPYWGWGYPYYYGYAPWWGPYSYYSPYDPYNYPDDRDDRPDRRCVPDYRHDNGCNDHSPDDRKPSGESGTTKPSIMTLPEDSPNPNYVTKNFTDRPEDSSDGILPTTTVAGKFQLAASVTQQRPSQLRPAVVNAIHLLRVMPPEARQQRLSSGRYDSFSPEERDLLISATQNLQPQ